MSKVRGIRFNEKEEALIEEFLDINPLLDFTTLAKIAILDFIQKPQLQLKPVRSNKKHEVKSVRTN